MASPVIVGTSAIVVAPINKKRAVIRFQNTSKNAIYLKKIPLNGLYSIVSDTDYEVLLNPESASGKEGGGIFETNSISSFMVIASGANSSLAVYETNKVNFKTH